MLASKVTAETLVDLQRVFEPHFVTRAGAGGCGNKDFFLFLYGITRFRLIDMLTMFLDVARKPWDEI